MDDKLLKSAIETLGLTGKQARLIELLAEAMFEQGRLAGVNATLAAWKETKHERN